MGADLIVVRHSSPGSPLFLSRTIDVPIVNAGDGAHEHPSQGLLDIFTLREKIGSLEGRKITILGDILFSRVARSNLWGLKKLGAEVTLAGPSTLVPRQFEEMGARVSHDLRESLADADAVMLLRIQHERQSSSHFPSLSEYTKMFGLNADRNKWLKPNALILHPGPINRGVEIDSELADSERAVILDQVKNGIAVRMAILYLCAQKAGGMKKMTDCRLKGARLIDPSQNLDEIRDLTVANGRITFDSPDDSIETIDCSGKIIMPGLVDIRGHLREPESLASIGEAAAFGGYTTILLMPNSGSPADNPGTVHLMREKASKVTKIEILQCGCLTKESEGEVLAPLGSLKEAGSCGCFGLSVKSSKHGNICKRLGIRIDVRFARN